MGLLARLLSFTRVSKDSIKLSDVKMNPDGGSNITGGHFADPGDDSYPLDTDYVVTTSIQNTGGEAVVGYADPINEPKALVGDKRIYARDSNGDAVCEAWLKSDGSVIVDNANGQIEIKADGEIEALNAGGSIVLKPTGELTADANTSMVFTAPVISLIAPSVILGDGVAEELVTKTFLFSSYNAHKHSPAGGVPTVPATAADHTTETVAS